jgi:hypothetical protein
VYDCDPDVREGLLEPPQRNVEDLKCRGDRLLIKIEAWALKGCGQIHHLSTDQRAVKDWRCLGLVTIDAGLWENCLSAGLY